MFCTLSEHRKAMLRQGVHGEGCRLFQLGAARLTHFYWTMTRIASEHKCSPRMRLERLERLEARNNRGSFHGAPFRFKVIGVD